MQSLRFLFRNESALLVALVEAVLVVAVAFGADLSGAQVGALVGLIVPLGGLLTRDRVWSERSVDVAKADAYDRGRRDGPAA